MNLKKLNKKTIIAISAVALAVVVALTVVLTVLLSNKKEKKDSIVIMTEELSGLFNPYYATSGADMDVVGMTQIGMLSTDSEGQPIAGDSEPTVVKDFDYEIKDIGNNEKQTVYTFVIKNNLKFSDGKPLTMNDVMFNIYEYLDPVYTGSSTMYSIDIEGLYEYRNQQSKPMNGSATGDGLSVLAQGFAQDRIDELYYLYTDSLEDLDVTYLSKDQMLSIISEAYINDSYKTAVATVEERETLTVEDYREILKNDYLHTLETFKEELESDFRAAKESFDLKTKPYSEFADLLSNDVFKFFVYENYIETKYEKLPNSSRDDKENIEKFIDSRVSNWRNMTQEQAINTVYEAEIGSRLDGVLLKWGTAGTLKTEYAAKAMDIMLHDRLEDGELTYKNISGIRSLGHKMTLSDGTVLQAEEKVTVKDKEYNVATTHTTTGVPVNSDEYDVLQITVNGTDPKAIYNFGFTVAPAHYYGSANGTGNDVVIDIENDKFGIEWSSSDFQSKVIQSQRNVEVPVGAGAFMATNADNQSNPNGADFWNSNVVYFKANEHFMLGKPKAEKLRLQVVSSTNAIDQLKSGAVDFISPQFTKHNSDTLNELAGEGYKTLQQWQLGYGYIGINAGKVPDINLRKAIMSAMDVSMALTYYASGTCTNIDWPMSNVSWAYPRNWADEGKEIGDMTASPKKHSSKYDYLIWDDTGVSTKNAEDEVKYYMSQANGGRGYKKGDVELKIRFTIAGASITEHPTYAVFKKAATILNNCDWDVEVNADSQALTRLATGSLQVWAAAWGSTIDPDMYQVYHKDSSATSVYAWGYREIKDDKTKYKEETSIIDELSILIERGREEMDQKTRAPIYEEAMKLVLDLAVEMPVYQRMTLYAYNSNRIKGFPEELKNSYVSPLEEIWNLE